MVQEVGNSKKLNTWGANGTIVEPSLAKKQNGWDLGEQPPHEYANWVLNILGQKLNHILQNGVPAWDNETEYAVGNMASTGGVIYAALQTNTDSEPPNAEWQPIAPYPFKNSLQVNEGEAQLVGDVDAPGNNKIYGTNASGEKGWQPAPEQADGFKTGDIKIKYANAEEAGFVRLNGRSIGGANSAATERANADTAALFAYLWDNDSNINVSGGRGASAAADFAADKRITLPDARGRALVGLDGMGSANAGRITNAESGITGTQLGAAGGVEAVQLTPEELPAHEHLSPWTNGAAGNAAPDSFRGNANDFGGSSVFSDVTGADDNTGTYNNESVCATTEAGEDEAHNNVQPSIIIGTVYIKL